MIVLACLFLSINSFFAADVWSIGVILYVLLAGYLPFDENTMAALFSKIKSADYEFPDWFSAEARDLISMILVPDPHKRPRITEIKGHPWMQRGDSGKRLGVFLSAFCISVVTAASCVYSCRTHPYASY